MNVEDEKDIDVEEEEDDEAQVISKKKPEYPFKSLAKTGEEESKTNEGAANKQLHAEHLDQTLEEEVSENEEVAGGEQDANNANTEAVDRALLRYLEQQKYQKRFTNYNDEESD